LNDIARQIEKGDWDAKPSQVFEFENIREAHAMLDSGKANGKMVVRL
jgi:NADPH:quinone reductase-like Zn-dependent oxidoreductase